MTVRKAKRITDLTGALAERRVMHLRDAAQLLGVSEMTVRRDIARHPGQFAYLGGHILAAAQIETDIPYELATAADSHALAKRDACGHAARHVRPGDTIFIDCGTTLSYLVEMIPESFQCTAVCYALNIAEKLARKPNISIMMLGGLYHPASASFSGGYNADILANIGINVAFVSAAGVDAERGVTCEHFHEAEIKQKVIAVARESYLVVDSSKLGKLRRAYFAPIQAFKAIITEHGETIEAAA